MKNKSSKNEERGKYMEDNIKVETAGRVKVKLVCEKCNESYIVKALQTSLGYKMDVKMCFCGSSELTLQPIVK